MRGVVIRRLIRPLHRLSEVFKKSRFAKNVSSVILTNGSVLAISLLSSIVLARALGPEGKGVLAVVLVYPQLIASLGQIGIRQAVVYEVGREKYDYDRIVGNVISLFLMTSTVGVAIALVTFGFLDFEQDRVSLVAVALAVSIIPLTLSKSYVGGVLLGRQRIKESNLIRLAVPVLHVILLVVLVWIFDLDILGALIATVAAALIVASVSVRKVIYQSGVKIRFDWVIQRDLLRLGSVFAIAVFVNSLNYRLDIILLGWLSTSAEVGLYSLGVRFAELVYQIPAAVGIVVFSGSANSKKPREYSRKVWRLFRYSILLAAAGGGAIALLAPFFIPHLYGSDFKGSVSMLQLIMPGVIAMVAYKVLGFDMAGKGKPWTAILASIPGLIVNVILNVILIPQFGGNGAAIASSVSYTVMGLSYVVVYRYVVSRLPDDKNEEAMVAT